MEDMMINLFANAITIGICFYLINLVIVCMMAHSLNRNVFGWVYVSIFLTPIIGITILLCLPSIEEPNVVRRRDRGM